MLWDLHKARKRKHMEKREQKMGDFFNNMELAQHFIDLWIDGKYSAFTKAYETLPLKYKYYMHGKYNHKKYGTPLSQEHMHMDETWRLWLLSGKIGGQAIRAEEEAKRLHKQYKAVHALMRHKMRKYIGA